MNGSLYGVYQRGVTRTHPADTDTDTGKETRSLERTRPDPQHAFGLFVPFRIFVRIYTLGSAEAREKACAGAQTGTVTHMALFVQTAQ
uniref:Uncharacterized protein n=1 Tax=Knipowitschia caucasica TaxID=637954 RepID=A0AAV2JDY1_KNICA